MTPYSSPAALDVLYLQVFCGRAFCSELASHDNFDTCAEQYFPEKTRDTLFKSENLASFSQVDQGEMTALSYADELSKMLQEKADMTANLQSRVSMLRKLSLGPRLRNGI